MGTGSTLGLHFRNIPVVVAVMYSTVFQTLERVTCFLSTKLTEFSEETGHMEKKRLGDI